MSFDTFSTPKEKPLIFARKSGVYLVGRGNLKRFFILLKFKIKIRFNIRVEYHLEYRVAGFEPGTPDC